jgi:hypothetical protein
MQASEKSKGKSPFEDGGELTLKGTPEMALATIARVAQELRPQGKRLTFEHDPKCSTETFIEGTVWLESPTPVPTAKKGYFPIAVIELYSLPDKRTLFRIPPRRYWGILEELSIIDLDYSFLTHLLKHIFTEFQRLGFVDFRQEKPPLGFRLPHRETDVRNI